MILSNFPESQQSLGKPLTLDLCVQKNRISPLTSVPSVPRLFIVPVISSPHRWQDMRDARILSRLHRKWCVHWPIIGSRLGLALLVLVRYAPGSGLLLSNEGMEVLRFRCFTSMLGRIALRGGIKGPKFALTRGSTIRYKPNLSFISHPHTMSTTSTPTIVNPPATLPPALNFTNIQGDIM